MPFKGQYRDFLIMPISLEIILADSGLFPKLNPAPSVFSFLFADGEGGISAEFPLLRAFQEAPGNHADSSLQDQIDFDHKGS